MRLATVAIAGFGVAHRFATSLICALRDQRTKDLTLVCNSLGDAGATRGQILAEKANMAGLQFCGKQRLLLTKLNWYVPDPDDEETRRFVARIDAYWTIKNLDRNTMPRTIVISCP